MANRTITKALSGFLSERNGGTIYSDGVKKVVAKKMKKLDKSPKGSDLKSPRTDRANY